MGAWVANLPVGIQSALAIGRLRRRATAGVCAGLIVALSWVAESGAGVTAQFWRELSGSGSGEGLTQVPGGILSTNGPSEPDALGRDVSVAVGPDGKPVVVYIDDHLEGPRLFTDVHVSKWDGSAWQPVGLTPSNAMGFSASTPRVAVSAAGTIVVAWQEGLGRIYLKAWNGAEWTALEGHGGGG